MAAEKMIRLIEKMRREGNTVGGIVEGIARGVPAGWGEPVFDKLEADLAKAMLSLPASKAFEVGSGFGGILLTGREHNDAFRARNKKVFTTTNRSGGIQGGISNGETIFFRIAFKPVATVMHEQDTVDENLENTTLKGRGRHDPCVLPRAVPMVEAMTALVLVDHALRQKAQCALDFFRRRKPSCFITKIIMAEKTFNEISRGRAAAFHQRQRGRATGKSGLRHRAVQPVAGKGAGVF